MEFKAWILRERRRRKLRIRTVAAGINSTSNSVHRYMSGERCPEDEMKFNIAVYTDGAVMPNDWFPGLRQLIRDARARKADEDRP